MNLVKAIEQTHAPVLYESGSSVMWTDEHISQQLLHIHLSAETDLASRNPHAISKTIQWILEQCPSSKLEILDLGCGPGLYCEHFAARGHGVTGIDFSANSIAYAKEQAHNNGHSIQYLCGNYCEHQFPEEKYDLVIQIFTDFGVLTPANRQQLLQSVKKSLKPGGIFIFDVMADRAIESTVAPRDWEISQGGFWKDRPYIHLSESVLYESEKVVLSQHIVSDETGDCETYRFWTHFFSESELEQLLHRTGFSEVEITSDILPDSPLYKGSDVLFSKAVKQ